MCRNRMFVILLIFFSCFVLLTGRLFWLQIIDSRLVVSQHSQVVQQSVWQRAQTIMLDDGRGDFYDRYQQKLTGTWMYTLAIFPNVGLKQIDAQTWQTLAHILDIDHEEWVQTIADLKEPVLWKRPGEFVPVMLTPAQIREIQSLQLPFIKVVPYRLRYTPPYLASHLIGFVSQNPTMVEKWYDKRVQKGLITPHVPIGASGLEWAWDRLLQGVEPMTLSLFLDGHNQPVFGLNVRLRIPNNPYYPLKIVTTIDKSIQLLVEQTIDSMNVTDGAVVVLDANNADVIAMASRPHFDPYHVQPEKGDWSNQAIKATTPGSIFKTVVAAAALEAGVVHPREVFQCDGQLGKYHFSCWKKEGHGRITFEQAFADSCNIAFAEVAKRLSPHMIENIAYQMGFMQQIGYENQWAQEEQGHVFTPPTDANDEGVIIQTAIGQRDVMITPLQAANLIVSLLHDGEVKRPRIVREIRYQNHRLHSSFEPEVLIPKRKGISQRTTRTILHWMEEVVNQGTGRGLRQATWKLAGKSGTAQVQHGDHRGWNQWFVGYGPVEQPRYAVAVLVKTDNDVIPHQAKALFLQIMNRLAEHES